jgi:hypothetical protein
MQFQDITRQKLERHRPTLAATAEQLATLMHETHSLRQRDLYRAVLAYAHSAIKPTREALETTGRSLDAAADVAPPQPEAVPPREDATPVDEDKKVEIF